MDAAQQRWIEANPFLEPLARFQEAIAQAAEGITAAAPALPPFAAHAEAYRAGVPLLRGQSHGPMLAAAGGEALAQLAARVAAQAAPPAHRGRGGRGAGGGGHARGARRRGGLAGVGRRRRGRAGAGRPAPLPRLVRADAAAHAGLRRLRHLARGRGVEPAQLPDLRPAAGHVAAGRPEAGRDRVLVCGCCPTRWGYKRVGCPYCGNDAADRMALLELQGSTGLRLDVCESCKGYVKTYAGQGEESLYLADWPTLLLDAMAAERGYQRRGTSLFDL